MTPTLSDVELQEHRMTMHPLSGEFGLTECGLDASTVHATGYVQSIDCRACALAFLETSCFAPDRAACPVTSHSRAARLAYPKMEVVR